MTAPRRLRAFAFLLSLSSPIAPLPLLAATGTHLPESTLYPRLVRLHHGPGPLQNSILAKTGNKLYRSLDEGHTFTYLTTVPTDGLSEGDPGAGNRDANKERCCSTLFELPRTLGRYPAGTLLYAGSFFSGGIPAVEIYTSPDQGLHWTYLSTPIKAGDDHHGLWEPEFTVTRDGALVMFVSDETDPCCSQKLVQRRTHDLVRWGSQQDTVASKSQKDRPGMAVVSRLPGGAYFMSYEVCGPVAHCQVFSRRSADGWNFGDPTNFGTRAETATGQYLVHTPANFLTPTGDLLLIGQMLYERDGTVSPQNGKLLFLRPAAAAPAAAWSTRPAPVEVPTAYDNYCPNYSSALLPVENGSRLLELASDYDRPHHCTSFFATLPLQPVPSPGVQ